MLNNNNNKMQNEERNAIAANYKLCDLFDLFIVFVRCTVG
jgi:hypothetical protein